MAEQLVAEMTSHQIEEKIAYHDWLVAKRDTRVAKNPAGFLAAAIRDNYRPPQEFQRTQSGEKQSTHSAAIPLTASVKPVQIIDALLPVRKYLAGLGVKERSHLEAAAVAAAIPFQQGTYERLLASGSKLAEEMQLSLVAAFLTKQGDRLTSQDTGKSAS